MCVCNIDSKKNFCVSSFGSGDKVKLPGAAANRPNVYEFGTSYDVIYKDLLGKDRHLYTQNGLLHMLDRNRRIKTSPQRLQDCEQRFDVLVSCEERVYDQIVESKYFSTSHPLPRFSHTHAFIFRCLVFIGFRPLATGFVYF